MGCLCPLILAILRRLHTQEGVVIMNWCNLSSQLPAVQFGPQFLLNEETGIRELPMPDSHELLRCHRLANKMAEMAAEGVGLTADSLIVKFGVMDTSSGGQRFCFFLKNIDKSKPIQEKEEVLPVVTEAFLAGISGKNGEDMLFAAVPEGLRTLVRKHVEEYLKTDGETHFNPATEVTCGQLTLYAPNKVAPSPPQKVTCEVLEIRGFVDALGRTAREIRVIAEGHEVAKAKFNVGVYLSDLCECLRIRGLCKFWIEQTSHQDGSITKRLLRFEQLQGDLFKTADSDICDVPLP